MGTTQAGPPYSSDYPHPASAAGRAWRERYREADRPDPYGALRETAGVVIATVQAIISAAEGDPVVFWGEDGSALVGLEYDLFLRVDSEGRTAMGYIVREPPPAIARMQNPHLGAIEGWKQD